MGLFTRKSKKKIQDLRLGFIFLNSKKLDFDVFISNMKSDWDIIISNIPNEEQMLMFEWENMTVACGYTDLESEIIEIKKKRTEWQEEATEQKIVKRGQVVLSVSGGNSPIEQSVLFTKTAVSLLKLCNAVSIYQMTDEINAEDYVTMAEAALFSEELPIWNWITVGIYQDRGKYSGFTKGLDFFGKEELEVIRTNADPDNLYMLLQDMAAYLIENDAALKHGQTVGYSETQKLRIKYSRGSAVHGHSFKIAL